jgi:hypothetical protein
LVNCGGGPRSLFYIVNERLDYAVRLETLVSSVRNVRVHGTVFFVSFSFLFTPDLVIYFF